MSVCGYIRIYLAVYDPEIIGGFGLEEKGQKTKAVCGLGRTNYGGLRNERPPIIDPLQRDTHLLLERMFQLCRASSSCKIYLKSKDEIFQLVTQAHSEKRNE